jgi:hypothetical protein
MALGKSRKGLSSFGLKKMKKPLQNGTLLASFCEMMAFKELFLVLGVQSVGRLGWPA